MADALKDMYNLAFLQGFAKKVHSAYKRFDEQSFVEKVMQGNWVDLALKQRMRRITLTLGEHLPPSFSEALAILYAIDDTCNGFPYLFFPDFVEVYGESSEHWELAMGALERFTARSSAEFAVRPFILRDPERMMRQMSVWADHPNEHVRRLASEGCRPRLPWGQALAIFKQNPAPVLGILEKLKADPSLYVRKSVANNLNDIAKDHPAIVLETAARWKGANPDTDWIVRHGCRTLIRQATPEVLALFGYAVAQDDDPIADYAVILAEPTELMIGENCELRYEVHVRQGEPVHLRIEYGIDFVKAGGKQSRKLFLLSDRTVPGGSRLSATRTHRWADLTTRRHYPGKHRIVLLVNGKEAAATSLNLTLEN
jgi:3-methyladenine DNA glycosylase AlkC